ncbi:class A sortase [Enterococcus mundtii]|uniref:class A sortase n=1 Tax=Enterococcus mundtii TaxID=53346 RepID=UPI000CF0DA0C|nr:class A sortase [Enterococcus mundtii]PQC31473.1 class A sortase [Enterococcus mundtii]
MANWRKRRGRSNSQRSLKILISLLVLLAVSLMAVPFSKYFLIATHSQLMHTTIRTQVPENVPPPEEVKALNIQDVIGATQQTSDDAIGQIIIPKVEISQPIFLGLTTDHLIDGVVSLFPQREPELGSLTLIGHHVGAYNLLFARIEELKKGDSIYIHYLNDYYHYKVEKTSLIKETEVDKLADRGAEILFLVTCSQEEQTPYRLFVEARKVHEEKAPIEPFEQEAKIVKKVKGQQYLVEFILPLMLIVIGAIFFLIFIWRT